MARVDAEVFGDQELTPVLLAATLAEARRAEAVLTERGVNYVVKTMPIGRSMFGSARVGAVFYVPDSHAEYCGAQLVAAGLGRSVLIDETPQSGG